MKSCWISGMRTKKRNCWAGHMKQLHNSCGVVIPLCAILCGCSVPSPTPLSTTTPATAGPTEPQYQEIQIVSQPPGARIEVNDDYICDAPCSVRVHRDAEGRFFESTTITAMPVSYGYTQTKFFMGFGGLSAPGVYSAAVPARIFFDMNLRPASQDINVNVNQ
jgi:hypothetical protein